MNIKIVRITTILLMIMSVIAVLLYNNVLKALISVDYHHVPRTFGEITWGDLFFTFAQIWGFYGYLSFSLISLLFGLATVISLKNATSVKSMISINTIWIIFAFLILFLLFEVLKENFENKGLISIIAYFLSTIIILFINRFLLKKSEPKEI